MIQRLRKLKQEDREVKGSLGDTVRLCFKYTLREWAWQENTSYTAEDVTLKSIQGQWEGSMRKGSGDQDLQPEFSPHNPHRGRMEPTPPSSLLTSTCTIGCVHTQAHIYVCAYIYTRAHMYVRVHKCTHTHSK